MQVKENNRCQCGQCWDNLCVMCALFPQLGFVMYPNTSERSSGTERGNFQTLTSTAEMVDDGRLAFVLLPE